MACLIIMDAFPYESIGSIWALIKTEGIIKYLEDHTCNLLNIREDQL